MKYFPLLILLLLVIVTVCGCLFKPLLRPPMFYTKEIGEIDLSKKGTFLSTEFSYPHGFIAGICFLTTNSITKRSPLILVLSIKDDKDNVEIFHKVVDNVLFLDANWFPNTTAYVVQLDEEYKDLEANNKYLLDMKVINSDRNLGIAKVVIEWGGS